MRSIQALGTTGQTGRGDVTDVYINSGDQPLTPSDAELILEVRGGDLRAFGALYERHAAAARRLALSYVRNVADAEDLVSDAFDRTLRVLQSGQGPDQMFRAYLFSVVRNAAIELGKRSQRTRPTDDAGTFEAALSTFLMPEDPAVAGFERTVVSRAYRNLPERWQAVLWYLEVEGCTPAEVAPILGLTPNGVSALAYRAREGLRAGYLQQHLAGSPADGCRAVNAQLGGYVRGSLAQREVAKVDKHLKTCGDCRTLVLELSDVAHGMRGVIAPLVLGVAGLGLLGALPLGALAGAASTAAAAGGTAAGGTAAAAATTAATGAGAAAGGTAVGGAVTTTSAAVGGAAGGAAAGGTAVAGGAAAGAAAGGTAAAGGAAAGAAAGGTAAAGAATAAGTSAVVGAAGTAAAGAGASAAATAASVVAGTAVSTAVSTAVASSAAASTAVASAAASAAVASTAVATTAVAGGALAGGSGVAAAAGAVVVAAVGVVTAVQTLAPAAADVPEAEVVAAVLPVTGPGSGSESLPAATPEVLPAESTFSPEPPPISPSDTSVLADAPVILEPADTVVEPVAPTKVVEPAAPVDPWGDAGLGAVSVTARCAAVGGVGTADSVVVGRYRNTTAQTVSVRLDAAGSSSSWSQQLAPGEESAVTVHDGVRVPAGTASWTLRTTVDGVESETQVPAGAFGAADCYSPSWDVRTAVRAENAGGQVRLTGTITNDSAEPLRAGLEAAGGTTEPVRVAPGATVTVSVDTDESSVPAGVATFALLRWVADIDGDQPAKASVPATPPTAPYKGARLAPALGALTGDLFAGKCVYDAATETSSRPVRVPLDNSGSTLPVPYVVGGTTTVVPGGETGTVEVPARFGAGSLEVLADGREVGTIPTPFESCATLEWPAAVTPVVTPQCSEPGTTEARPQVRVVVGSANGREYGVRATTGRYGWTDTGTAGPGGPFTADLELARGLVGRAGTMTVELTRTVEGQTLTVTRDVPFESVSCAVLAPEARLVLGDVSVVRPAGRSVSTRSVSVVLDNSRSNVRARFTIDGDVPGTSREVVVRAGSSETVHLGAVRGRTGAHLAVTGRAWFGLEWSTALAVEPFTGVGWCGPAWDRGTQARGEYTAGATVSYWGKTYAYAAEAPATTTPVQTPDPGPTAPSDSTSAPQPPATPEGTEPAPPTVLTPSAPATTAPETKAPESKAPATAVPETRAPATTAPPATSTPPTATPPPASTPTPSATPSATSSDAREETGGRGGRGGDALRDRDTDRGSRGGFGRSAIAGPVVIAHGWWDAIPPRSALWTAVGPCEAR